MTGRTLRAPGALGALAVLGALAASALVVPPLVAQAGPPEPQAGPVIERVELRGVERLDEETVRGAVSTEATECRSLLLQPLCWISDSRRLLIVRRLDSLEVARDAVRIRLLYWLRGYRDAAVATSIEPVDDGVRVLFTVREGPPTIVTELVVTQTDSVLPHEVVQRAVRLREGDPLNLVALDSSVALLTGELWDRGYAAATVTLDTTRLLDARDRVRVGLQVRPGARATVAAIRITGNRRITDATVRRLLTLHEGGLYRRSAVEESRRNLYLTGMFSAIDIGTAETQDSSRTVVVQLAEGALNHVGAAAGFNTVDFVQVEGEYTRRNFLGGARRLTVQAAVGNVLARQLNDVGIFRDVTSRFEGGDDPDDLRPTWQASAELMQPWLRSPRNQLGLSVFGHRRIVPGIVVDEGHGGRAALTRELAPRASATLAYRYETTEVQAGGVYFCVTAGVCDLPTIRALRTRHALAPLSLGGLVDRTNDALEPSRGYVARAELEHASAITGSAFRYNRAEVEGTAYWPVGGRSVLAGRLRAGWVDALGSREGARAVGGPAGDPSIHPRKRFFAGGALSVRGFGENQLGPRILTVAPGALTDSASGAACTTAELAAGTCDPNIAGLPSSAFQPQPLGGTTLLDASVEYRRPLWKRLGLALFVDAAVIGQGGLGLGGGMTGAITPGAGVRFRTPVGPVRVDVGFRPTLVERLPVVTEVSDGTVTPRLVRLETERRFDPVDGGGGWFRQVLERLTIHLAIGPSF